MHSVCDVRVLLLTLCSSEITDFVQNFVQISKCRQILVQRLKGISFANGKICNDFQVCIKKCSISLYYGTLVSLKS